MTLNVEINDEPYFVFTSILSRISRKDCTSGVSSVPYVAVAIKHPPPVFSFLFILVQIPFNNTVPSPHLNSPYDLSA